MNRYRTLRRTLGRAGGIVCVLTLLFACDRAVENAPPERDLVAEGRAFVSQGDLDQAIKAFTGALAIDREDDAVRSRIAELVERALAQRESIWG